MNDLNTAPLKEGRRQSTRKNATLIALELRRETYSGKYGQESVDHFR